MPPPHDITEEGGRCWSRCMALRLATSAILLALHRQIFPRSFNNVSTGFAGARVHTVADWRPEGSPRCAHICFH